MARLGVQISFVYESLPKICSENPHQDLRREQMIRVEHELAKALVPLLKHSVPSKKNI
jgi:hypothetical protein